MDPYPGRMPKRLSVSLCSLLATVAIVATGCGQETVEINTGSSATPTAAAFVCPASAAETGVAATGTPTITPPKSATTELCTTDIVVGTGREITEADATTGTKVTVNYVGMGQKSGKVFDSSFERGSTAEFPLNRVIKGWTQAMVGMKIGGRRQMIIPGELAYGANPPSADISDNETLIFVVDLVSAPDTPKPLEVPKVDVPAAPVTELGIKDITIGTGAEVTAEGATSGVKVSAFYVGVSQSSGKSFDESFSSGQPTSFPLNGVIPGWTKGLVGMKVGGRRQLTIPGELAYGAKPPEGSGIAADDTLIFVIDLVTVG